MQKRKLNYFIFQESIITKIKIIIKELKLYKNYKKNLEFLSAGYIYKPYYKKFKIYFKKNGLNSKIMSHMEKF